jgi:hypothetical protein
MFKTVADIKRKMTIGSKWHTMHHGYYPTFEEKDLGIRVVSIIQSNSYAFRTPDGSNSWGNWPKKSEVIFHDNDSFTILQDSNKLLTYTFIGT